jgi:hypothetical protein
VHFAVFLSEVWPRCHPADPPLLLSFTAITDHARAGEVLPGDCPSTVGSSANQDSNQFLVPGRRKCGVWRLLNRSYSFALSKRTTGAASVWASLCNYSTVTHHRVHATPFMDRDFLI